MNVFDYLFAESQTFSKYFLVGAREQVTFPELYRDSMRLAGYIQKKVGTGKNIILLSHNNLFFITAYLGILKSGNTVVPINPAIEPDNLAFIINQCACDTGFFGKSC